MTSSLRPYECSAQGQGEPRRGGRGATAPSIVRKIKEVQRGEQVPSDGGLALPKDVRMKPFSLKSFLHTNLDVLVFTLARGSNGFPGGHAHFDPGRPSFCPDEESCMSLFVTLLFLRRPDMILTRLWIVRHEFTIFEFGA
jgi:hypothetical protein